MYSHSAGTPDGYADYCSNDRTLHPTGIVPAPELPIWWSRLSPTARKIEEALTVTDTDECRYRALLHHIPEHTFAFVESWILSNKSLIQTTSDKVRVKPALVAGILASEMLFDYGTSDQQADTYPIVALRLNLTPNQGFGYANPHFGTRVAAYNYLQPLVEAGSVEPVPTRLIMGDDIVTAQWLIGLPPVFWSNNCSGSAADWTGVIDARMQPLTIVEHLDIVE